MGSSLLKERFEALTASSGVPLASLTPRMGLDLMLRFLQDDPARGCLKWSWGTVTRYGSEELGFSMTYWPLYDVEPEPAEEDFSLLFKVGPQPLAGDFAPGFGWITCEGKVPPIGLAAIEGSYPWKTWNGSRVSGVALVHWDHSINYDLFDCWGARDPSRPVLSMAEDEWLRSEDVPLLLRWFRQEWGGEEDDLDRLLTRYCLACCRKIWKLLPHEKSRAGVEVAERYLDGLASREEFGRAEWDAEGAAFLFSRATEAEEAARWAEETSRIPIEELDAMLSSPRPEDGLSPLKLLEHAAHFADSSMVYFGIHPKESIERYRLFLSAPLLREIVGNPFDAPPHRQE